MGSMPESGIIIEKFTSLGAYARCVLELNGTRRVSEGRLVKEGRRFGKFLRHWGSSAFLRGMLAELRKSDPELFEPDARGLEDASRTRQEGAG